MTACLSDQRTGPAIRMQVPFPALVCTFTHCESALDLFDRGKARVKDTLMKMSQICSIGIIQLKQTLLEKYLLSSCSTVFIVGYLIIICVLNSRVPMWLPV